MTAPKVQKLKIQDSLSSNTDSMIVTDTYSWGIKGYDKMPIYDVKLPLLQALWAGRWLVLPLEKWVHFLLGPWRLVCQSIEISNQMEVNGHVSNFG